MSSESQKPITVIQPPSGWAFPNLREVWQYREVVTNFVKRNFKITYRQTIGGPIYAIYTPFMSMVGYSLLLGGLFNAETDGDIPYPLFSFSALIAWTLFTSTLTKSSSSLTTNSALIQKIYIPRIIFPLIEAANALMNFVIAFFVLLFMMLLYGYVPSANVIWLPFFTLMALACAVGIGLWFAGLHARFRDTTYIVGLITKGLFFLTPVVYSSQLLPAPLDQLYKFNPMAVVVEGFRWALIGVGDAPGPLQIGAASIITLFFVVGGSLYFKRLESTIADVI